LPFAGRSIAAVGATMSLSSINGNSILQGFKYLHDHLIFSQFNYGNQII